MYYETDEAVHYETNRINAKMKSIKSEMEIYLNDMKENLEQVFIEK